MRVLGVNIKVLTCWHFIRERYFMTTQEKQKKLSLRPLSPRDPNSRIEQLPSNYYSI
jgi:hypothetical protein